MIKMLQNGKCKKILIILSMFIINIISKKRNYHEKLENMFYILQWTLWKTGPFMSMEHGSDAFIFRQCEYQNCFITNDTHYFRSIKYFDVLLFNVVDIHKDLGLEWPTKRSPHQKYVFVSRESHVNYPISPEYDGYFNWTWTHRFDSDIRYEYIAIRNRKGELIGPKKNMKWINLYKMKPISKYLKRKLRDKRFGAAWFVSNCEAKNNREGFAEALREELKKYNEVLDIYGSCGNKKCPTDGLYEGCYALIEHDYYFYLAFENAHSEDYVSEKLLNALQHYAVPIVFGGANYSDFMPDGMYLDASALGPQILATEMVYIISNKKKYYNFFKWHRYYTYYDSNDHPATDGICDLCAKLNNDEFRTEISIHVNLSAWWNETLIPRNYTKYEVEETAVKKVTEEPKQEDRSLLRGLLNTVYFT